MQAVLDPLPRRRLRLPERQAQVDVVGDQAARLAGVGGGDEVAVRLGSPMSVIEPWWRIRAPAKRLSGTSSQRRSMSALGLR